VWFGLFSSCLLGLLVNQHFNWLSAVSVSLIVAVVVGSCFPSSFIFMVGRLPKSLRMEDGPYEEFAREHGEVPGWTRGIRAGKAVRRKRQAYIRHRIEEGEDPDQVAIVHQDGQARPLHTPRTWGPNADSSDDGVGLAGYPEPRRSLSDLSSVQLVPPSVLYQPVRTGGLVPKARGFSDPYDKGKSRAASAFAKPKASASASSSVVSKAKPVSAPSSSSQPRVITIEDGSVEPASASSPLVDPYRFSGPQ
jgi:hypothetical protein